MYDICIVFKGKTDSEIENIEDLLDKVSGIIEESVK